MCLLYNAEESEETLKNTKEIQKKAEEKYEVLENKMKNAEAERERELKDAQKKLDCAKTKADASSKKMKEKQQVTFLKMEIIFYCQHRAEDGRASLVDLIHQYSSQNLKVRCGFFRK